MKSDLKIRASKQFDDGHHAWDMEMRDDGQPSSWPISLEVRCGKQKPTLRVLIEQGFTITKTLER